jgi:acetylornithine deacetylase/succinyl-diaminopimelate desuccinylase-like protein
MTSSVRLAAATAAAFVLSPAPLHAQGDAARLRTAVRAWRVAHEGAIVREFAGLLAIPNVASDTQGVRRNAEWLVAMLSRRGLAARLLSVEGAPPVVYGELRVPGASHTVALYAHYDGQPVDPAQWASPPWTPTLRDGPAAAGGRVIPMPGDDTSRVDGEARLHARSAGDDKVSILAMLAALDALRAAGRRPSVNVKVFFEGEEEAGSPHLRAMLERNRALLAADAWLFCDGPVHQSGRHQVEFGARGMVSLELTLYGPARTLHSGHYGNWAVNPAALMANLIASMRDEDGRILIAGFSDDVAPISPAERRALAELPSPDSALRQELALARTEADNAPLAERIMLPALNVRGLASGAVGERAANAIPTEARSSFDFRLVPQQTPERVRELVTEHLRRRGYWVTGDSVTLAMRLAHPRVARAEWGAGYPASRVPLDLPFARALLAAVADGTDQPPLAVPTVGASGPTYLFEDVLGAPMLMLPIANYDNSQHGANENLRIHSLWDGIELYAALLARLGVYWDARPVP